MMQEVDILIIGAGASGLMAACAAVKFAAGRNLKILLLERQKKPGRKILASGNGRCNLGHSGSLQGYYHGNDPDFVEAVFAEIDENKYRKIFRDLGVLLTEDESGRLYPRTMRSDTVQRALLNALDAANVTIKTGHEAKEIVLSEGQSGTEYIVSYQPGDERVKANKKQEILAKSEKKIRAKSLIMTTGGMSQPQISGHHSGYKLLQKLGHSSTELLPALAPLELNDANRWRRSSGIRVRANACYRPRNGGCSLSSNGEFLFTDYGVSGIAAMELAEAIERDNSKEKGDLLFDLLPDLDMKSLEQYLQEQIALHPSYQWEELLTGLLPQEFIINMLNTLKYEAMPALNKSGCRVMAMHMKQLVRPVKATRGFNFAQVTAGGIRTDEVEPESMLSKRCPGLLLAGELLDVNADTGGYNLQWAFSSAYVAGINAAKFILSE